MRRIVSFALASLLTILLAADLFLWHRGYTLGDNVIYRWFPNRTTLRFVQLYTARGGVRVLVGSQFFPPQFPPQLFGLEGGFHHSNYDSPRYPIEIWDGGKLWGGLGFYYYIVAPDPSHQDELRIHRDYRSITFPHALVALLLLLYPLKFAWNFRRQRIRHLRRQRGLCLHCGYDLRGLSECCPECGAAFS